MNNTRIATVRTTVNTTVISVAVSLLARWFGWEIDVTDPVFIAGTAVVVPVFYRASIWASEKWPAIGYILFGKVASPKYD